AEARGEAAEPIADDRFAGAIDDDAARLTVADDRDDDREVGELLHERAVQCRRPPRQRRGEDAGERGGDLEPEPEATFDAGERIAHDGLRHARPDADRPFVDRGDRRYRVEVERAADLGAAEP